MTLTQIKYFTAVCEYGSFTKAAEVLFVSQPALSKMIKSLETECGVDLFIRRGNLLELTEEGRYFLEEVKPLAAGLERLESRVREHNLHRDHLNISYSLLSGFGTYIQIVSEYKRRFPDIRIMSTINNTAWHYAALERREVDFAITTKMAGVTDEDMLSSDLFGAYPLTASDMMFCVNKNDPWADRDSVTWEDIAERDVMLPGGTFSAGRRIAAHLAECPNYDPARIHFTEQVHVIIESVRRSIYCGLLTDTIIENITSIVGIPCPMSHDETTYLVWNKKAQRFWAAEEFLRLSRKMFPRK